MSIKTIEQELPDGFSFHPAFLDPQAQEELLLKARPDLTWPDWTREGAFSQSFGNTVKHPTPLPPWAATIADRLTHLGIFERMPNHVFALDYPSGVGRNFHIDNIDRFDDTVFGISLLSPAILLMRDETGETIELLMRPGDGYAMKRRARYKMEHAIAPVNARRISFTFRESFSAEETEQRVKKRLTEQVTTKL